MAAPRDPDDARRRWRCSRDPSHNGIATVPLHDAPAARWVCPYCARPVELSPAPAEVCSVCGAGPPLRRQQSPSGAFELFCAAHDPLAGRRLEHL